MTDYNGWSNYETWNVKLWLDNDEGIYNEVLSWAKEVKGTKDPEVKLADRIKDYIEENAPELGSSCYADLLNASLGEVNYYEIAESILEI